MRSIAGAIAAAALLFAGPSADSRLRAPPLVGVVHGEAVSSLVRLDPGTLRPLSPRLPLPSWSSVWAQSPAGDRLAWASIGVPTTERPARLRIADLAAWRIVRSVPLPVSAGVPSGAAWLGDRVLVVLSRPAGNRVIALDPPTGAIVGSVGVDGRIVDGAVAGGRLVLLVGEHGAIVPARLVTIDRSLHVRSVVLSRTLVGTTSPDADARYVVKTRIPGLALSPSGRTAVVVGAGEPVARIDLDTMRVSVDEVRLVARVAKLVDGPVRVAAWLGGDSIVIGGVDTTVDAVGDVVESPAGIVLLDVGSLRARTVVPGFAWPVAVGGYIVATGRSEQPAVDRWRGDGLVIRAPSGRTTRLLGGRAVWVQGAAGGRVLVTVHGSRPLSRVVDVATGRVVASYRARVTVLTGRAASISS